MSETKHEYKKCDAMRNGEHCAHIAQGKPCCQCGYESSPVNNYAALAASHKALVEALRKAELDCRGYDAVHGWLEEATEVLSQAEALNR